MATGRNLIVVLFAALLFQSCGGGGSAGNSDSTPKDTTPPVVLSTNPSNHATAVPVNTPLTVTFSEPISPSTPSSSFIMTQGTTVASGAVSFSGASATYSPSAKLGSNLSYTATLTTGVKDVAGNAMAAPFTWSFITSDCSSITLLNQFALGSAIPTGGFECMATDGTSIYLWTQVYNASNGTLFQIDPLAGQITSTVNLPLVPSTSTSPGGIIFIADITWHDHALWATGSCLTPAGAFLSQGIFKLNVTTGLAESPIPIAAGITNEVDILQGLASDGVNFYVAIDQNFYSPTSVSHVIVKFAPASSAEIPLSPALMTTSGQTTRLDYGNGFLWVWVNPNFQKADPATGAILSNFCKNDGGANILYLNHSIWSIKDSTLMSYGIQ